jgi:hypothetical protein
MNNYIIYGPPNSNKYGIALGLCNVRHEKKFELSINNNIYYFYIGDNYVVIDFEVLGKNSYNIWFKFYNHMCDISSLRGYYIICKNFNYIKYELMERFYVFMRNKNIGYIICTRHISFISDLIKSRCKIIICNVVNKNNIVDIGKRIEPIIDIIKNKTIDYNKIRDYLYNILIFNINIHDFFEEVIFILNSDNYFDIKILDDIMNIIRKYNNNYRSIYHLELFVYYLIRLKN